jgi:transaldolase
MFARHSSLFALSCDSAGASTVNPDYPDLIYVEPLIGPMTVNTMPKQTIAAFFDQGTVRDGRPRPAATLSGRGRSDDVDPFRN